MELLKYISQTYPEKFRIFGLVEKIPSLRRVGEFAVEDDVAEEARILSSKLAFDEDQAILTRPLSDIYRQDHWEYVTAKYSYITTLRNRGKSVEVITANILPLCVEEGQRYFLFQKRSESSGLYAGYYSIFGGSFSPELDKDDIYATAIREINEEISGVVSSDDDVLARLKRSKKLLTQETDNGNLQINFLGVEIDLSSEARGEASEGDLIRVKENEIEKFLQKNIDNITPLALGALAYYV